MNDKINTILLRNIAILAMSLMFVYFWFPVRLIIWKILFIVVAIICVFRYISEYKLLKSEVAILAICIIQILYYVLAYANGIQYQSVIGNVVVCLLSFPMFSYLGRKGVLEDRFVRFVLLLFITLSIICYFNNTAIYLEMHDYEVTGTKVNMAMFLFLLPLLLAEKHKRLSMVYFIVCVVFNTLTAKRGNIVASIVPILIYLWYMRKKHFQVQGKLGFYIILVVSVFLVYNIIFSNEAILWGFERMSEGDVSGRDAIYNHFLNKWLNSQNIVNLLFGYGFGATVQDMGIFAHNDWLELLVSTGLLGVVVYIIFFSLLFSQVKKTRNLCAKNMLLMVTVIWLFKSAYSMGIYESEMSLMALSYGYAVGCEYQS